MKKKLISLLAIVLMAIMLLSIFASCKKNVTNGGGDETTQPPSHRIPKKDYGGVDFTFITRQGSSHNVNYLVAEAETGEVLPDAIARRNSIIEEKYNVKIAHVTVSDIVTEVRTQVMGGQVEFDAILASCQNLAVMAQEGLLYNLLDIELFNWDGGYWDTKSKDQLMIGDKLYFANCSLNIQAIGFIVYFNKKLVEDYNLTSPYEHLKNNTWTIDTWAEMVKSVSKNMDGNDQAYTELDQYGTLTEHHNPRMFLYASGVRATTNDANGYPVVTLMENADKTVGIYSKLQEVFKDKTVSFCINCGSIDKHGFIHKWDYMRSLFMRDLYMFYYEGDNDVLGNFAANMESEFGLLPFPKYDQAQEDYRTVYPYNDSLLAIPSIQKDLDRTARIIEDMNFYSEVVVVPTWFDTMLSRRYARDDESEQTLHILRENRVYDLGLYYDFGGLTSKVLDVDPVRSNIQRNYDRYKSSIDQDIQKIYSSFTKPTPAK